MQTITGHSGVLTDMRICSLNGKKRLFSLASKSCYGIT